jgi:hypothetical protein
MVTDVSCGRSCVTSGYFQLPDGHITRISVWVSGKSAVGSRLPAIDSGDPAGEVCRPGHFGWLVPAYAILAGLFALAGTLPLWWLTRLAILPGIGGKRSFGAVPAAPGRHARPE